MLAGPGGRRLLGYPAVRAVVIARALDPAEDEDVRHNCRAGLWPSDPEVIPALRQLAAEDNSLGSAARERLTSAADAEPLHGLERQ